MCENMGANINPGTFQAQVRDQVAANIQYGSSAIEAKIFELPSRENEPTQIGKMVMRMLDSKQDAPK